MHILLPGNLIKVPWQWIWMITGISLSGKLSSSIFGVYQFVLAYPLTMLSDEEPIMGFD